MINIRWNKWWLAPVFLILLACEDDDVMQDPLATSDTSEDTLNRKLKTAVYDIMNEWYLWNDQLPEVNPDNYDDADALLNAMMNKPTDKWSYIQEEETYNALFERGEYEGYGVRMARDLEGNLRVAFVYDDSPFGRAGVERSWIIDKINGTSIRDIDGFTLGQLLEGSSHQFAFVKPDGSTFTENFTKSTIGINTVMNADVLERQNKKIGYLAFNSFLATSEEELDTAFQHFQASGIDELIVDLRYNGGGRVNIAEWMASNIIGNAGAGKNFLEYSFNKDKAEEYNETVPFNAPTIPLNLDRIVVITSRASASASELLINGLRPFIEVKLVGDDTYGKPVGSFPFFSQGYAISPIIFKIVNDQGVGEYYEGLQADVYVEDDLTHKLGDTNESRLKEALYYLENGTFSGTTARQLNRIKEQQVELSGFQQEIGAY
jgi:C-terminal processing protease CtpA/Prc